MFEAVIAVCLAANPAICRDTLLPGYEALQKEVCEERLLQSPPQLAPGDIAHCAPVGRALDVTEVAQSVLVHEGAVAVPNTDNLGDVANLAFVVGGESVAVIDTGSAPWIGEALWRAIRAETDKPVSHVILTHMHPDHIFGTAVFENTGAEIVAHDQMQRDLADRAGNYLESMSRLIGANEFAGARAPKVTLPVADTIDIDLGGRILTLKAWSTAHTGNDLTVVDKTTGTLFAGDLVFHRHTPALDGKLTGWRKVLGKLARLDVKRVVPGHGDASLPWPDGGAPQAHYLSVLERDTRDAIARGDRIGDAVETIASSEAPQWELFSDFNPRNATVAFTELEWE